MIETLACPWVESPLFEDILPTKNLTKKEEEQCRHFHRNGYLILEELLVSESDARSIDEYVQLHFDPAYGRVADGWKECEAIRNLATHERVLSLLRMMYEREPVPANTLNFVTGTEQPTHSDSIHFSSMPARYMCGVWVALEDVTTRQGALHYYPGSHRLPEYDYHDLGISEEHLYPDAPNQGGFSWANARTVEKYHRYEGMIAKIARANVLERLELELKRGQFLIWASNLFHGGSKILERGTTRRSQVTHYLFADTIPIVPMFSNMKVGEYFIREPVDIRTLSPMARSFNGLPVDIVPSSVPERYRIELKGSVEVDEAKARTYFERYPDVARSHYGTSLAGALRHYQDYGKAEGRRY